MVGYNDQNGTLVDVAQDTPTQQTTEFQEQRVRSETHFRSLLSRGFVYSRPMEERLRAGLCKKKREAASAGQLFVDKKGELTSRV